MEYVRTLGVYLAGVGVGGALAGHLTGETVVVAGIIGGLTLVVAGIVRDLP